ncbi:MAG: MgtC/SapB family protein [Verrucomicrobia bacterium]|nr:MAG: MgtC/SapB family protein [Verrucomicrobiota bacterium]
MDPAGQDAAWIARQLGIAVGLGLLVGLQRERAETRLAGIRTFPLVAAAGFACGHLAALSPWLPAAGLAGLAALLVVGHLTRWRAGETDPGLTTEVAALLMYLIGAWLAAGPATLPVVLGGGLAVLLHLKPEMHRFTARIGEEDFRAIMQFVLITLVILPVLPNQGYGPAGVWNPFKIWLLVVLIVGLSLAGYIAYKFLGETAGVLLAGALGGLVSSTATTFSFARRARDAAEAAPASALVISLASTVVFARVLLILAAAAPALLAEAWRPFAILMAVQAVVCLFPWARLRGRRTPLPPRANPTELRSALVFALLFAVVLWAVAMARRHLGESGLYAIAALSGLTDVDAITLSTAEMAKDPAQLPAATAWRLILVAALANMVFKAGVTGFTGGRRLFRATFGFWSVSLVGGAVLLVAWPG